ncbi:MAG TPA: flagellar basal-body rod protein FlgG [Bacillota bacterium]
MIRALWTAGTGMVAQQINIDTIANNLANVNTTGFKKVRPEFQDLLYQNMRSAGSSTSQGVQSPTGIQIGLGTRLAATTKIFTQGDFLQTDNPLDLVIEGDGFFQVEMPDGSAAFTRNGAFKVDSEGRVVTSEGYVIQPEITIPEGATDINVGSDGTVSAVLSGESDATELGQIEIAIFRNPAGLVNIGKGLYRTSGASGEATSVTPGTEGSGTIVNQFLEMSNVKVVEEMINMIVAQRAYDINSKAIQAADEMLQTANGLRR